MWSRQGGSSGSWRGRGEEFQKKEEKGFDLRSEMIKARKAYLSANPELMEWDIIKKGEVIPKSPDTPIDRTFTNYESMELDVYFLMLTHFCLWNHVNKISNNAHPGIAAVMEMLCEKYNVDTDIEASRSALGARMITLPKIAACYPYVPVDLFQDRAAWEPIRYETTPGTTDNKPETHAIVSPLLPSTCPRSIINTKGNNIHPAMFWLAVSVDDLMHPKEEDKTPIVDILKHYRTCFEFDVMEEKSRIKLFKDLSLLDSSGRKFHPKMISFSSACLSALEKMRPHD